MLKVLANEDRLLILCQLIKGARNVGELEALLDIQQPTLSQQLTVLREEGLVTTERKGKYIIYSLTSLEVIQIMQTLYNLYCGKEKFCDPFSKRLMKVRRELARHIDFEPFTFRWSAWNQLQSYK